MRIALALAGLAALAGCAANPRVATAPAAGPVTVQLVAFNDFHGNLERPNRPVDAAGADGATVKVPAGGVAYMASAVASLRATNPNTLVVSAGDMIGASPLPSSLFLDEPTIAAMNMIGVDLNAVGNHEFDRGRGELLRMQNGGCAKFTLREPCALEPFKGARFRYLAANVIGPDGAPLFPGTAIRSFGTGASRVKIGFIGMTLRGTANLVSAAGVAGLSFRDEAETANALVPKLKAEGADAIVVLIHEGLYTDVGYDDKSCGGVHGDLMEILARLDPAIDLVVSGHTHRAYICDYGRIDPARPFLVTSAGVYGTLLTDITLGIDPATHRVVGKRADNIIVQAEGATPAAAGNPSWPADPAVSALVARYVAASKRLSERPVGKLAGPAMRSEGLAEQTLGDMIADAQLAAARAPETGGAQIAFMNSTGVRADLIPRADGTVTFGDIYMAQPFNNQVVAVRMTGRQLRALLEQQFDEGKAGGRQLLLPSAGLRYGFDLSRPVGQRVIDPRLDGVPLADDAVYRVAASNFLIAGGDGFTAFQSGTDPVLGMTDIDAFERYLAAAETTPLPVLDRVKDLTPR